MNSSIVPSRLEEWSYEVVCELVNRSLGETYTYDFKAVLSDSKPEGLSKVNYGIRKTTAAFANTVGGFIIFGVLDEKSGVRGTERIRGIEQRPELSKEFADKTKAIQPTVHFDASNIMIPDRDDILWIVYIPLSPLRPHSFLEKEQWHFWKRGRGGNLAMTYEEMREQFLGTEERRRKLQLFYFEARRMRENLKHTYMSGALRTKEIGYMTIEANVLESLLPDIHPLIHENFNLLNAIGEVRKAINIMQLRTRKFTALEGGQGATEYEYEKHNQDMQSNAQFLEERLNTVIAELEKRYGMDRFRNLYVA